MRIYVPILWDRVQEDLPYLTKRELAHAKRSKVAYTRFYEDPDW
jgi:hypothetical protein